MSTDIRTGNIPVNISSPTTSKAPQHGQTRPSATDGHSKTIDTVSMTDEASRLKSFEAKLADTPQVNSALVAEVSKAIADGSLDMDVEGAAAKLIEMESGQIK
ncbi:MAG: flagellar biosynthesis anti-sigma factor FlgM [SAR86 cluster bacterium]|uniref:Negative regulator of flagellin synthesis n=1 Tax=SAR86 cluster bacterium TaxID=2030880 RepID=A0A2A5B6C4_9GAMM|nr:MAG: flagellar biosynthesis anti-sigma factor FlgM [SAR86 cluster bacterium]